MAVLKSDQITNLDAVPQVLGDPTEFGGRIRSAYFSFTVPTGNAAVNDTVQLTKVPSGARILDGRLTSEAMSTAGGDASIQIGDGTTAAKYLGTTSVDAAAEADFANTFALNSGEKLTAELVLTATVITEAWLAAKKLNGYVRYVVD